MNNYGIRPIPDKDDVRSAFIDLLEEHGETTSLDVKKELRRNGFWATQEKVTGLMREVADEEGIDFTFNGTYRTYYEDSQVIPPPNSALTNLFNSTKSMTQDLSTDNPVQGDWEVRDVNDIASTVYYESSLTAGQAKYQYCKLTGVDFTDARVKKVL